MSDFYFESFSCQIHSDENWVEQLILMENINRLLEEEETE
jgi:hypothetical protein